MRPTFCRLRHWLLRIIITRSLHRASHHANLRLLRPLLYSEKIQWRKLFDMDARYSMLSDKAAVRTYVAKRGFEHLLIPILWCAEKASDIPFDRLAFPVVLKSTHASGQILILRNHCDVDMESIDRRTGEWLATCYGTLMIEAGYVGIPRRLIVEPLLLCANGQPPMEYKIFVFHDRAEIIMPIFIETEKIRHAAFYRRNWHRLDWGVQGQPVAEPVAAPARLAEMLHIAEKLAAGFDHLRVDLYLCDDKIFFGEITIYSWSGLKGIYPVEADRQAGAFWQLRNPASRAVKAILQSHWGAAAVATASASGTNG